MSKAPPPDDSGDMDFQAPPDGFDPLEATPKALASHGFPPPPDSATQPDLHAAWLRFFSGKPPVFTLAREQPVVAAVQLVRLSAALAIQTRILTSPNWAGALIVPHDSNRFVQIYGEWKVPTLSVPPATEDQVLPPDPAKPYQCSTWIGLDGDRRYLNSTLPQIGTRQKLKVEANGSTTESSHVFFQWWARNEKKVTYFHLPGVPVAANDEVMGLIWVVHPKVVRVFFRNFTQNSKLLVRNFKMPDVVLPNNQVMKPVISGATAEWIVDRPLPFNANIANPVFEPFPAYKPVVFKHCVTGVAETGKVPTSQQVLTSPRYLRMFEVPPNAPSRTKTISRARRDAGKLTAVRVSYGG